MKKLIHTILPILATFSCALAAEPLSLVESTGTTHTYASTEGYEVMYHQLAELARRGNDAAKIEYGGRTFTIGLAEFCHLPVYVGVEPDKVDDLDMEGSVPVQKPKPEPEPRTQPAPQPLVIEQLPCKDPSCTLLGCPIGKTIAPQNTPAELTRWLTDHCKEQDQDIAIFFQVEEGTTLEEFGAYLLAIPSHLHLRCMGFSLQPAR